MKDIEFELKNADSEDIEDLIVRIEKSFNIRFEDMELAHVKNFGELTDAIIAKINLENVEDCTSQQAFYKLRQAIQQVFGLEKSKIVPEITWKELLKDRNRRKTVKRFTEQLGLKLSILGPPGWLVLILVAGLIGSLVLFAFSWKLALGGLFASFTSLILAFEFGTVINCKDLQELTRQMVRNHYLKSRRNPNSINRSELEELIRDIFADGFDMDKPKLGREATSS